MVPLAVVLNPMAIPPSAVELAAKPTAMDPSPREVATTPIAVEPLPDALVSAPRAVEPRVASAVLLAPMAVSKSPNASALGP